jgi:hypothetical protein
LGCTAAVSLAIHTPCPPTGRIHTLTSGLESVAATCNASVDGICALLNYLSSMQFIEYQPETSTYTLTSTTPTFLVCANRSYAGDWVLANTDPVLWEKMLQTIRSGKSAGYTLPWAQDAWLESYSPSRIA